MVYAYLLENKLKYTQLDNSEEFGAIKVYKLSDDYIAKTHSDLNGEYIILEIWNREVLIDSGGK
jgi:hypothetical protein